MRRADRRSGAQRRGPRRTRRGRAAAVPRALVRQRSREHRFSGAGCLRAALRERVPILNGAPASSASSYRNGLSPERSITGPGLPKEPVRARASVMRSHINARIPSPSPVRALAPTGPPCPPRWLHARPSSCRPVGTNRARCIAAARASTRAAPTEVHRGKLMTRLAFVWFGRVASGAELGGDSRFGTGTAPLGSGEGCLISAGVASVCLTKNSCQPRLNLAGGGGSG